MGGGKRVGPYKPLLGESASTMLSIHIRNELANILRDIDQEYRNTGCTDKTHIVVDGRTVGTYQKGNLIIGNKTIPIIDFVDNTAQSTRNAFQVVADATMSEALKNHPNKILAEGGKIYGQWAEKDIAKAETRFAKELEHNSQKSESGNICGGKLMDGTVISPQNKFTSKEQKILKEADKYAAVKAKAKAPAVEAKAKAEVVAPALETKAQAAAAKMQQGLVADTDTPPTTSRRRVTNFTHTYGV